MGIIKYWLVRLAAKVTGRKCCRCHYNRHGACEIMIVNGYKRCWSSLDRPWFLPKTQADLTDEELRQIGDVVDAAYEEVK